MAAFDRLEAAVGRRLDIVHLFQAWGSLDTSAFRFDWVMPAVSSGRRVLLTWEPWVPGRGPRQSDYALDRIVNGSHDAYIESWALALAGFGRPIWLRPMHEMNGAWYPWGGAVPGNRPEAFVAAWHHLRAIFRRAGASNVSWVWAPNSPDVPEGDRFERFYPGDAHVDVLGIDGYNWGARFPTHGGWRTAEEVFAADLRRVEALAAKPIWITETASSSVGGDKAAWTRGLVEFAQSWPRIKAVVWFDVDKECDWRLAETAEIAAAFGQVGSSRA
jgi:beta-mannanase